MDAFHEIGYDEFVEWGRKNKTKFYQLCGKMIPLDVKIEASHKVLHVTMALPPPRMNVGGDVIADALPVNGGTRTRKLDDGSTLTTTFTAPGDAAAALAADPADEPQDADLIPAPPTARDKRETEWREDLSRRPPKEAPV
jgi:hypothetical protein